MKQIIVETASSSYKVKIGENIFNSLNAQIKGRKFYKNVFIIADGNVLRFYRGKIEKSVKNYSNRYHIFSIKPGESSKAHSTVIRIYSDLLKNNYGRDTLIVAIGGGVTGDIAGYVASTFMRGVQIVHVPTTLIADVDSAIGGKTGINFDEKKNIIGTFYQPQMVIVDTDFLGTLPSREILSGLGEIIKYSFLIDHNFYTSVLKLLPDIYNLKKSKIENLIYEAINFKASVVSADEKENGVRKILNLGHTFAHAFESVLNFKIKHGEAVIAGILSGLYLSYRKNLLKEENLIDYMEMFAGLKLPGVLKKINLENLYGSMLHDKKNRGGKIKFVLLREIGIIVSDVEADKKDVLWAVESALKIIS